MGGELTYDDVIDEAFIKRGRTCIEACEGIKNPLETVPRMIQVIQELKRHAGGVVHLGEDASVRLHAILADIGPEGEAEPECST